MVGDGRDLPGVPHDPGDVALGRGGEVVLVLRVEEGVLAALEERLVDMHAAPVLAEDGLGMNVA